jgi:hypothetical protein
MTRVRSVVALVLLVLVVGLLAGLSLADPFHLRHARWFTAGLVALGVVLFVAALAVLAPRGLLRGTALLLGLAVLLWWGGFVAVTTLLTGVNRDVGSTADGGRRLVVVAGSGASIDPVFAVVLRSGGGPFEQESLVYQGVEGSPQPAATRFLGPDTVEVQTLGGCSYRSDVEAVTLAVDPVHRPLQPDSC